MFLRFADLPVVDSHYISRKETVDFNFTAESGCQLASYNINNLSKANAAKLVKPHLLKKLTFTISDRPGDPEDDTVSDGELCILDSFDVDQHSILSLNFHEKTEDTEAVNSKDSEKDCEDFRTFCRTYYHIQCHVDCLSKDAILALRTGDEYYINCRSFEA